MKRYEREVFANVPIMSTYNQYTDKNDFPNHGIIYRALPDQILRAAFMLTWKAGVSWKEERNRTIRDPQIPRCVGHQIPVHRADYPRR